MNNREIAQTFATIADLLAIRGDSVHRVLAYRRAAENVTELGRDLDAIRQEGKLQDIPGIGATLAAKIAEMLDSGRLEFYETLTAEIPGTLVELLRVEGLGPKRVKQLYDELGIESLEELSAAAQAGRLRELSGLGKKSEAKILAGIATLDRHGDERMLLGVAWPIAHEILSELRALPGVIKAAAAGSLRRMRETTGDIDLLVAAEASAEVMRYFREMQRVDNVLGSGPTKTSVVLHNGVQVDLRVLAPQRWGTLLSYFTGSKAHNVRLREVALAKGFSLNEHAFTSLEDGSEILCASEEAVYEVLDLPYIPPQLREDRGEIEAASARALPELVSLTDLRGDLHMHTTWSDGRQTVREMARAAQALGHEYIVITDHSASLGIANGLSVERLWAQQEEIRAVDEEMGPAFRVLHGSEIEIRADGSLDYTDDVLAGLDFVIASLHMSLAQPRDVITRRALAAIENPHVDMLAHPTGRLMPERAGADLDMDRVLAAAAQHGTILEVNASPSRLDLRDSHVRRALEIGVRLAINTDAHHSDQLELTHFGVGTAQRGWATATSVVNTWPIDRLLRYLRGRG
ncbi:MAG: DNA polymerase/3'-5' exonuclease PolX [Candidatus Promineifilaceae bacterium]|nr:DNA polymerase/3'-5' exonuclease PolX [Candidatus Promineifilaceae bacterium]